jgi:uncharacterized membrane protein (DUF4010 family)
MFESIEGWRGLLTALGIGLLIGAVRERQHATDRPTVAGVRTHALIAIVAAVAALLGAPVLVAVLVLLGVLGVVAYLRNSDTDPGLTGEVALLATATLSALAQQAPLLAPGLAVLVAALLAAKQPMHRFVREVIDEREVRDGLLLAGAALVVLPWLPTHAVDPWGALVPAQLWRLVVLVLAVGMAGHVALRWIGQRWGFALSGFLAGVASSTAAVASFGQRTRSGQSQWRANAAAALLANLASLGLLVAVVAAVSPPLLHAGLPALAAAGLWLLAMSLLGLLHPEDRQDGPEPATARAFRLGHALLLAVIMAGLLLVSAWLQAWIGPAVAVAAAAMVALAEVHAATVSVAQLQATGLLGLQQAVWGLVSLLWTAALAKCIVAALSGTRAYVLAVAVGLFGSALCATLATLLVA